MAVRAAILPAVNAPLRVAEIDLPEPGPGQVRIRLAAAGVCHSDLSLSNGTLRQPAPAVLGHEGAGTVTAVGPEVTTVAPGDKVVLNWAPSCGSCHFCGLSEPWLCAHAGLAANTPYATLTADGSALYPGLGRTPADRNKRESRRQKKRFCANASLVETRHQSSR
ncbi:alcohol dehydrogenase catalytic domain-containing protein, partial [Streptomyces sp. NPDC048483]|uniref:alcohol dehydrogenase catalytic domain-containing protein n=1 Tax=Streptomyces sp. NPDC048483 TaxID=3154927 RepID=UPI0034187E8E